MGLFDKKFRTRVRFYLDCKYVVEYAYYRFIPIWISLNFWFDQGHPGGTECWSINLFDVEEAESIALSLKKIEDVTEYYKPFKEEEKEWRIAEKKYLQKNAPYTLKNF